MNLNVGDIVGDYEILSVLGAGGMGKVFRVRNVISQREEAMKMILPDSSDTHAFDRFLREIKLQASLIHANIVAVHTAMRAADRLLMVMELVEGQSLAGRLEAGPLPAAEAVHYIDQVLAALSYAHGRGVVHRDVKPPNILITLEGVAKLTDFGIARNASDQTMTGTGRAIGSLYYMSPEQVKSEPVDERSDVYSLGATLYEALTGRRPIEGTNEFALMQGHLARTPLPPDHWVPGLHTDLSAIVLKALNKSPANRFASALEFRTALEAFRGAGRIENPPADAPSAYMAPAADPVVWPPGPDAATGPTPANQTILVLPNTGDIAPVEVHLSRFLGPISRSLVKDAARRTSSLKELCEAVAIHLEDKAERAAFLRACTNDPALNWTSAGFGSANRESPAAVQATVAGLNPGIQQSSEPALRQTNPAAPVQTSGPTSIDPAALEAARQALAPHIGPIAKVMVERASRKARSAAELFEILSTEIADEKQRRAFMSKLRR